MAQAKVVTGVDLLDGVDATELWRKGFTKTGKPGLFLELGAAYRELYIPWNRDVALMIAATILEVAPHMPEAGTAGATGKVFGADSLALTPPVVAPATNGAVKI